MNKIYERYLQDEDFRASIERAARRERRATVHALLTRIGTALEGAFQSATRRPRLRRSRMIHRSAFG